MGRPLGFGICTDQNMDWPTSVERWKYFEALGFDSIWNCDHFEQPSKPGGPYLEAWTMLAGLAAVTERIRIGVLVTSNTFRHPGLLVKEAITVDLISDGRLEFGIGAGWYVPEHEAYGLEFLPAGQRVDQFEEAVEIMDSLFRNEETTYHGQHYQLVNAPSRPRPAQQPRPPFTIGAHRPRMMRIVAKWADRWNTSGDVDEVRAKNELLDEALLRRAAIPTRSSARSTAGRRSCPPIPGHQWMPSSNASVNTARRVSTSSSSTSPTRRSSTS